MQWHRRLMTTGLTGSNSAHWRADQIKETSNMDFITVNQDNIDKEHICCCITDKKGETCVSSKKSWMKERFADGLVFRRTDTRGKVFIEYIPAENAWYPIEADGYMHINCFWGVRTVQRPWVCQRTSLLLYRGCKSKRNVRRHHHCLGKETRLSF